MAWEGDGTPPVVSCTNVVSHKMVLTMGPNCGRICVDALDGGSQNQTVGWRGCAKADAAHASPLNMTKTLG